MPTFADLKGFVYADCGYGSSPPTTTVARIGGWINEAYKKLLREPGLVDLRQGTLTFNSVINQTTYGLPQVFETIQSIVQSTNNVRLRFMSRDVYRRIDPGERSFGLSYNWIPEGYQPVSQQPQGTGLWINSTSASDTNNVIVSGARTNGDAIAATTQAMTGVTLVQIGALIDWSRIETLGLSVAAAGVVTIYSDAGGTIPLGRIPIGRKAVLYDVIRLWPTATAVLPYVVDGLMIVPTLVADTDVPIFPESYHDVLSDYARMKEYERTGSGAFAGAQTMYLSGSQKLKSYVEFPSDYRPVAGSKGRDNLRWNNLGSYYPADWTWP